MRADGVEPHCLPQLLALLGSGGGTPEEQITRALETLLEQLDLQTAFVSRFVEGRRHFTHLAGAPPCAAVAEPSPVEDTICSLIATGVVGPVVADTAAHPVLATHPHITQTGIGTYVGVPLVLDGDVVGAVCGVAATSRPALSPLDADRLATVGAYIGNILKREEGAGSVDAAVDPVTVDLSQLATTLLEVDTLESLTRPLLELVQAMTGLESTYLTFVDWAGDEQRILSSHNTGGLVIPDGLRVTWSDTLCRRSLDEGVSYTADVPAVWPDSGAATALGIQTYVSVPISDADDAVIGTLCGASSQSTAVDERHLQSMKLFARILADQMRREQARERDRARARELEARTHQLRDEASRDDLTGLSNRTGIHSWLQAVLPQIQPGSEQLAIAFIDVDHFKAVNDVHGHAVGDDVLRRLATSLTTVGRATDLHGRLGGDEFVVAALLPGTDATVGNWTSRLRRAVTITRQALVVSASVGVTVITEPGTTPETALHLADQAMYQHKAERRQGAT